MTQNIIPILVTSNSTNPWFNLALEEYLFNNLTDDEVIMYLWQNDNTVVVGKNQNAWKECNYEKLEKDNGKLARRLSGGGAVYHDLGNLNFTYIMHNKNYNIERQINVLKSALSELGVNTSLSGRNDMLINDKKFSGHAYYYRDNKAYHHGTLLVHSDLDKLTYYLNPSKKKMQSHGVESVRSRVCNISDYYNNVNIGVLTDSLITSFQNSYGTLSDVKSYEFDDIDITGLYEKYASWEWCYGKSPNFDVSFSERFEWGEIEFKFKLKSGIIEDFTIYSDAMDAHMFDKLKNSMVGQKYQKGCIINQVKESLDNSNYILCDIINWINSINL